MIKLGFSRNVLGVGVAAVMLAGCGGQTATSVVPSATTAQGSTRETSHSWMKRGSTSGNLLYATDGKDNVLVFSYPQGHLVGALKDVAKPWGACSDSQGNVFITNRKPYQIVEYAHGGTTPINVLSVGEFPQTCAVDPTTDNLAVPQIDSVDVFANEQGSPQMYTETGGNFWSCTYDDDGNLFLDGEYYGSGRHLFELPSGSNSFTLLTLNGPVDWLYGLQWDGKYLALDDFYDTSNLVYQVQVSGSNANIVGSTTLEQAVMYPGPAWIEGKSIVAPIWVTTKDGQTPADIDVWRYPAGGKPTSTLPRKDFHSVAKVLGVTVSVAPSK